MIRLLLADDQALVRGALAALLDLEPDLEVVAEVGRGDEVVGEAPCGHGADVALLDVEMPGLDGIAATAALRRALPGCRVLIVTTFGRPGYLRRAMEAGASGFVVKDTPARQLADAVRRVHAGLRVVDPALAAESLVSGDSPLTARETEVLRAARDGGTVADIAGDAAPVRGHGAQPPVRGDRQDRRPHPRRGGAARRATTAGCSAPEGCAQPLEADGKPCRGAAPHQGRRLGMEPAPRIRSSARASQPSSPGSPFRNRPSARGTSSKARIAGPGPASIRRTLPCSSCRRRPCRSSAATRTNRTPRAAARPPSASPPRAPHQGSARSSAAGT